MSVYDLIMFCWLLPSFLTFLIVIHLGRKNDEEIENWDWKGWFLAISASILYPGGLVYLFTRFVGWKWLLKDR